MLLASEVLDTIQELAQGIVQVCEGGGSPIDHACMKNANEILRLAASIREKEETGELYGQMEGPDQDADRVSGSGQELHCLRHKADRSVGKRQERALAQLQRSATALPGRAPPTEPPVPGGPDCVLPPPL